MLRTRQHAEATLRKRFDRVLAGSTSTRRRLTALENAELAFKKPVFGCQACGNCVLGLMEYVCPMTCPKNMRNGPCGGTFNGQCEVIPEQALHLGQGVRARPSRQSRGRIEDLHSAARPRACKAPVPTSTISSIATAGPSIRSR